MRSLSERAKDLADAARAWLEIEERMRTTGVPGVEADRAEKRLRFAIQDVEQALERKKGRRA